MRKLITVLLVLATVLALINIHPIEACRVLEDDQMLVNKDLFLLSSLRRKTRDPPSAPNPRIPSSIGGRAFAGHAVPLPRAEAEPQGSLAM